VVNANLKIPGTNIPAQKHFIDGVNPVGWDVLIAEMMSTLAPGSSLAVTYTPYTPPTGTGGPDRYLALISLYYTDVRRCCCCGVKCKPCVSHFGQEVSSVPPNVKVTTASAIYRATVTGCGHHVSVKHNSADPFNYDVALKHD
jgi:hypothetical protein